LGTLIVHCENRPKDSIIDVDQLGWFINGHVYKNVEGVEGTLKVGTEIPPGRQAKLPTVDGDEQRLKMIEKSLAPFHRPAPPALPPDAAPPRTGQEVSEITSTPKPEGGEK